MKKILTLLFILSTPVAAFAVTDNSAGGVGYVAIAPQNQMIPDSSGTHYSAGNLPVANDDENLIAVIKQNLVDKGEFSGSIGGVQVSVINGRVSMRGTVRSEQEKKRYAEVVTSIPGVNFLENNLQVADTDGQHL